MSVRKIAVNLPKFKLPENFDEKPLLKLKAKLLAQGYDVRCKSTLAFFLVGRKYRLQKASETFISFVKYIDDDAKEKPTESQGQDFILGYCQQPDGTLCMCTTNYAFGTGKTVMALSRQWMVYLLANVTYNNIVHGFSGIHDAAGFGWRNFSREMEEFGIKLFMKALPLRWKDYIIVDSPWWFSVILNICRLFVPKKIMDRMKMVNRQDMKITKPRWKIPKEMGGLIEFEKLSMKFLMEFPYLIETPGDVFLEEKSDETWD